MRRNQNIEYVRDEAIKLGATFKIEQAKCHVMGIIYYNGQKRKTAISTNNKDQNIEGIIRKFVRRAIREMGNDET